MFVHTLENGLRVVVETMPQARTVAVALWLNAGAVDEAAGRFGTAHFLEHMLFRGTAQQSGRELAARMDRLGGEFNAATGRETTSYYGWVPGPGLDEALSILAVMLLDSSLAAVDVERERAVIREEIRGDLEVGETRALLEFDRLLWGRNHALGRPITGTLHTVSRIGRADLLAFLHAHYTPPSAVLSIAGCTAPDEALARVRAHFGRWRGPAPRRPRRGARPRGGLAVRRRALDQVHLVLGGPAPAVDAPGHYETVLMTTLLGGGSSSRAFQAIREREGLAYQVYSFHEACLPAGNAGVYMAVLPGHLQRARRHLEDEIQRLMGSPPSPAEVQRTQEQIVAGMLLVSESPLERANLNAESLLRRGRIVALEEVVARIRSVSGTGVQAAARSVWGSPAQALVAVGPLRRSDLDSWDPPVLAHPKG